MHYFFLLKVVFIPLYIHVFYYNFVAIVLDITMSNYKDILLGDTHFSDGLNSCMNCGVCTAVCPAAEFYNYDPRVIVDIVQRGDEAEIESLLKSNTIWYCGECMSCKPRCPRGNTPGEVVMALRKLSVESGLFVESEKGRQQFAIKRAIADSVLRIGYCVSPDVAVPEKHPEQGPVWEWIYANKERVYERVHANYDGNGAGALRHVDEASLNELKEIFNVTGGTAYMECIEQSSKDKAESLGMEIDEYLHETYTFNSGGHGNDN